MQLPQNLPCATVFNQSTSRESQKKIENLKAQIDLLFAKIDSLVELKAKKTQGNSPRIQERGQFRQITCYRCGFHGHYARSCTQILCEYDDYTQKVCEGVRKGRKPKL